MKDIFSPIFLTTLALLFLAHRLDIFWGIVPSILLIIFTAALTAYVLRKFRLSYIFTALSLALLITVVFLKEKEDFYRKAAADIPQNEYITLEGKLIDFPEIEEGYANILLETKVLEYQKERHFQAFNIRIKVKGSLSHLFKGDTIAVNARVYLPRLNRNFFANPYENYLLYKKIHFNGFCKSAHMVNLTRKGNFAWRLIGKWRNEIRQAIEGKYLQPEGVLDKKGVFMEAILLGDRGRLGSQQKDELLDAGVFHLLAISGAHIGMIAIFLLLLFKTLRIPFRSRYTAAGLFLILFLVLSGFKISAQRAVLMALLIFTARIFYLDFHIFNIISFCGLILLVKNPAEFLDPGFILTFTLTAAIVMGREIFLPGLQRLKRIPPFIKEFLCANFSASLISLPLSLLFFKRYSFAGFLAGLVLLPITALVTAMGLLLILLAPLSPGISSMLLHITDIPLGLFFKITGFFSRVIHFTVFRPSPHILWVILILVTFYLLSMKKRWRIKLKKTLLLLVTMVFILSNLVILVDPLLFNLHYQPGHLEVFFLAVGQGDSQVVVFPGGEALLIDGGGTYYSDFETGKQILLPFILQKRIKIKWVAVSHFHPDHVKGIIEIIHILKPQELWLSSAAAGDLFYQELIRVVKRLKSIKIKKLDSSFSRAINGCKVECLYPVTFIQSDHSLNNHSQVLKVSDQYNSFLFTGDIEGQEEAFLVKNSCRRLSAQVLKVPHHGSRTSSSLYFLTCSQPRLAVFSHSLNNRFNFPHPEVIQNFKTQRILTLSTAGRGGIHITSRPGSIKIDTSR